jgi:hypothetical protein
VVVGELDRLLDRRGDTIRESAFWNTSIVDRDSAGPRIGLPGAVNHFAEYGTMGTLIRAWMT